MDQKSKLILFDAQAVLHRAWHALPKLTNPQGKVVNAVYGFTSLLIKIIKEQKPNCLAVAFDTKAPTFRHQEYQEYKAGREKQPQEFYNQIDLTKKILAAFDIPIFYKDGFEADDLIGAIIEQKKKINPKMEFLIISGDLDLCQLVDSQTSLYYLRQGINQIKIYQEKEIEERFLLKPNQLIDFKALKGDPSDNIKGIEGIGPKTALNLIKNFKTLEKLYQSLEKQIKDKKTDQLIKNNLVERLWKNKDIAFQSKRLVTIEKNIPGLEIDQIKNNNFSNNDKIIKILGDFGFKSLIKRWADNNSTQTKMF
jgi:DNA polymerase-1